jgi:hypothetical protein
LEVILKEFQKNKLPRERQHHVIGNHCLKLPRDYLQARLEIESNKTYYDFTIPEVSGWRFIVLDGTDISVYGWDKDHPHYKQAEVAKKLLYLSIDHLLIRNGCYRILWINFLMPVAGMQLLVKNKNIS